MTRFSDEAPERRICVALDCPREQALCIARSLQGKAAWVKVGMTLYYAQGPRIVEELKELGFRVFLDLKLHDIPHQVRGAAASAVATGADMVTVHASGGGKMMQAAAEGAAEAAGRRAEPPVLLGITVLTSMGEHDLAQVGVQRPVASQVEALAQLACDSGLSGVVCSPQEAAQLRGLLGKGAYIVTPGVRLGQSDDDQERTATPAQAFASGASHIVVGRPITGASDPAAAFQAMAASLAP